ncbi:MAG: ribosome small subunit-dependent GTPase A [Planctomycetota bacterium]
MSRKGPRRNRPARRKDWARREREDRVDELGQPGKALGGIQESAPDKDTTGLQTGTVLTLHRGACEVEVEDGAVWRCAIRRTLKSPAKRCDPPVVVGDVVHLLEVSEGEGVVEAVEPRRNQLDREHPADAHRDDPRRQVLAANVDQLLLVVALADPEPRPGLIDRYLVGAAIADLPVVLVLNKIDLVPEITELERVYRNLGLDVVRTCAESGEGVEELRSRMAGKRSVVSGHSGVGKSSLLSALDPEAEIVIGEVNEVTGRGRHTTSTSRLWRLQGGIEVADTPGIRAFGPSGVDAGTLAGWFPEIAAVLGGCKFSPCSHIHEPECTVKEALEQGAIARFRYESYCRLHESLTTPK